MAFKPVLDLNADVTITIGGVDRKTQKKNANSVEGYFLGSREIADKMKKTGKSYVHIFQTANGNVGVWGKTDLDRKLVGVGAGLMTRVTFNGMRAVPTGEMYTYRVETDADNTIDTSALGASNNSEESLSEFAGNGEEETEELNDEPVASAPKAPAQPAKAADAARQARVKALLEGAGQRKTA